MIALPPKPGDVALSSGDGASFATLSVVARKSTPLLVESGGETRDPFECCVDACCSTGDSCSAFTSSSLGDGNLSNDWYVFNVVGKAAPGFGRAKAPKALFISELEWRIASAADCMSLEASCRSGCDC